MFITAFCVFVLYQFIDIWEEQCVKEISIWLLTFLVIQLLHLIRSLILIIMWIKFRDPALGQMKLEFFYGSLVFILEAAWSIYGSTFIYSDDMDYCKGNHSDQGHAVVLWFTCLIMICLGYLLILYIIAVIFFACVVFMTFRSWNQDQTEEESRQQHKTLKHVPLASTMESYR